MTAFNAIHLRSLAVLSILSAALAAPASAERNLEKLEELKAQESVRAEIRQDEIAARAARLGLPLRQELKDGTIVQLYGFGTSGAPIYYTTDNLNAARTVSADDVWPEGSIGLDLTGAGQEMGIWDGGSVRTSHQEFNGRVVHLDGAGLSNHSTHVGGTMVAAGVNANARGMSYEATLRSHDFGNDAAEMIDEQMAADPIKVSNHSYSFISGWTSGSFGCPGDPQPYWFGDVQVSTEEHALFGLYTSAGETWDQLAYDSPGYLPVKSAGNDRNDDGPGDGAPHCHWDSSAGDGGEWVPATDSHPGDGGISGYDSLSGGVTSAKNPLTVGAVADIPGGYTEPSDVVMSSFSGWGPTDDGRIKPDLVANGLGLISSTSNSDTAYGSLSGTSMSAPNASGSLGLLHQHAQNLFGQPILAATLKALVLHTADEAGASTGPDYTFGWGLLNVASAADVLSAQSALLGSNFHVREEVLSDGGTLEFEVTSLGTEPLHATITWTDPAGPAQSGDVLDPPTQILVNDLDLRVEGPDTTMYLPWTLDPASPESPATPGDNFRDVTEQVWIAEPTAGVYTVRISHKGTLDGGLDQAVSLVVTGNGTDPVIFSDGFESGDASAWSNVNP